MNIGERLKKLRYLHKYKQREVAEALKIDIKMYQAYEYEHARTPVEILIALSEFYGYYSIDHLLGRISQVEYCEMILNKYLLASPEKRKIVDFILHLQD